MFEDNMILHRKELTDLTALVANVIYDVYYTQCYVRINTEQQRQSDILYKPHSLSQKEIDDVFQKTEDLLKQFQFERESDKIMDIYNKILIEDRGLLCTEQNISDIISLVVANCDQPLDIGPCIMHFNSFVDEEDSEMQEAMDKVIDLFDSAYMERDLKHFIFLCSKAMPLLVRYVINELEICDLLKPLGVVNDAKVYYINVESKPAPPIGYSDEFSYPLIPYHVTGYIDSDGNISPHQSDSTEHVYVRIVDMNIYQFDNTEEYVNIIVQIRNNDFLQQPSEDKIMASNGISLSFKDYLKLYMTQDVVAFLNMIVAVAFNAV